MSETVMRNLKKCKGTKYKHLRGDHCTTPKVIYPSSFQDEEEVTEFQGITRAAKQHVNHLASGFPNNQL